MSSVTTLPEVDLVATLQNGSLAGPLNPLAAAPTVTPFLGGYGTALDQVRPGLHAGSTAVRDFIQRVQPAHFFCGHIHEAEGVSIEIGQTHAHNVGKKAYLLELD